MDATNYIMAARILATCPKKRLPYVLKLLREAGIEVDESVLETENRDDVAARQRRLRIGREVIDTPGFGMSDDDFFARLNNAFAQGISVTQISRVAKMSRTSIYRYLNKESAPSARYKKIILDAIDVIMEDTNGLR